MKLNNWSGSGKHSPDAPRRPSPLYDDTRRAAPKRITRIGVFWSKLSTTLGALLVLSLLLTGIAYGVGNQVFNAGAGIEITTDSASDLNISTQATTGGGVSIGSRGGTDAIYVNTSNNVGIGTAGPATKLHVSGGAILGGEIYVSPSNLNTLNSGYTYAANDADIWINYRGYADGQLYYRDFRVGDGRGNQIAMFDGSSGNVGIGVSPSYKLDVSGAGNFTGTVVVGTPTASSHAATKSYVDTVAAGGTLLSRSGSYTYVTNTGDNFGIGTTSPSRKLDINDSTIGLGLTYRGHLQMGNDYFEVGNPISPTGDWRWEFKRDGTINHYTAEGGWDQALKVDISGNVGIGNTSPDTKLRVDGTVRIGAGNYLSLLDAAGSERGYFQASGGLIISTSGGEPIVFKDGGLSGDTNMTIGGTGAVNIPGTLTFYGSQRIWNGDNSYIYIRSNSSAGGVRFQNNADANVGYVYGNTSTFGLLNSAGNWAAYFDNSSNIFYTVASYGRTAHSTGYLAGSYNNVGANDTKSNPIYVIGTSYAPTDTSLSNMYGIGYSHGNFWGSGSNRPTGWGMYVASSGTIRVILSGEEGIVWALNSLKAPLFYDTDDQNYYVDPHNVSYVNDIRANIFYDKGNTSYYVDPNSDSRLSAVNTENIYFPSDHTTFGINRANDDSYEWVGWYSGANRSAITIWDGAWNACATDRFCIIGESHQLTFQSLGHNVLVYDNLDVTNSVTAAAFYYSSDASLKFDIQPAAGLEMVRKLDGVTFRWKDTGAKSAGLIAQDVEKVLPEAVSIDAETGKKTLNPAVFTGYMVEAIKELDAKVQKLETENADLRDRLERIER